MVWEIPGPVQSFSEYTREQVHREIGADLQSRTGEALDFDRPERLLKRWCHEAGIPYLALLPGLRAAYDEDGVYLHGFGEGRTGHWNQVGHRLAAREILEYLEESGLLPAGAPSAELVPQALHLGINGVYSAH